MNKHKLSAGDGVWLPKIPRKARICGTIEYIEKGMATVAWTGPDGDDEYDEVPVKELEYIAPKKLSPEDIRRFVRFECGFRELTQGAVPESNLEYEEYLITLDDMEAAVRNLQKKAPSARVFYNDWFEVINWELDDKIHLDYEHCDTKSYFQSLIPETDDEMARIVYQWFDLKTGSGLRDDGEEIQAAPPEECDRVLADIAQYRNGGTVKPWNWSQEMRDDFVSNITEESVKDISDEMMVVVRELLQEYCEKGDPEALENAGYAYYGGNAIYGCDWVKSRDCFLKLLEIEGVSDLKKCQYANTLGYIFYYGRCNNGVPEYEKALKYYTLGAGGWIYESIYKLSDMYKHGYGTPVNKLAAKNLIWFIWEDNIKAVEEGHFNSKFADVALRMGNLCRDGIEEGDPLRYYMMADFAIRKRLQYDWYGDPNVFTGIQEAITQIREKQGRPVTNKKTYRTPSPGYLFGCMDKHACRISLKKQRDGETYSLKAVRIPEADHEKARKYFIIAPDSGYCDLVDRIQYTVHNVKELRLTDGKEEFIADSLSWEWEDGRRVLTFRQYGEVCAVLDAGSFVWKVPAKKATQTVSHTLVGVTFTPGGRRYDYLPGDLELQVGDRVIVLANGEEKEVEVVKIFQISAGDMPLPIRKYKTILRKI